MAFEIRQYPRELSVVLDHIALGALFFWARRFLFTRERTKPDVELLF
jgi:hypothetical protein